MTVASKIQELGCKKVMIVCDDWLSQQENFKAFMNTFSEVETYVWNHVIPDPTDISVEEGAVIARQETLTASSALAAAVLWIPPRRSIL